MPESPAVIALLAAHNEGDVIAGVVGELIRQGVAVYLLDHGSTDGTVAAVAPYRNRGLLRVERFPDESGVAAAAAAARPWECLLRRKEQLAAELEARWFLHHDADEYRESPWENLGLADALARVERLGYNAVDFRVLNFPPTHDRFRPGDDPRTSFPDYEPAAPYDFRQIKAWRKQPRVELVPLGGHEAIFPERNVFPIRFLCRHYPLRGRAHALRKFRERRVRFAPERDRGWHLQYDRLPAEAELIRDPATLTRYDPERIRFELCREHRDYEAAEAARAELERKLARSRKLFAFVSRDLEQCAAELDRREPR